MKILHLVSQNVREIQLEGDSSQLEGDSSRFAEVYRVSQEKLTRLLGGGFGIKRTLPMFKIETLICWSKANLWTEQNFIITWPVEKKNCCKKICSPRMKSLQMYNCTVNLFHKKCICPLFMNNRCYMVLSHR